jgi:NAD(P)-dependent dehydrogenase (short-subunit alcohol dehydrogenase family)
MEDTPDYVAALRLDGRAYVVLGAGQGIGLQAALAIAACGGRPMCVDVDPHRAEEAAQATGGIAASGDATSRAEMERLFARAHHALGRLDGLVDIIGGAQFASLADVNDAAWDREFDHNLRHAFYAMQIGSQLMEQGGAMAFVASVSGITGAAKHAAYGAAKAGLMALVRSAAVEFAPRRIRVNAVAPGSIGTPRAQTALGAEGSARSGANAPLGRVGRPSEIAGALLFCLSDLSSYMTGQTLVIDGGVSAKFPYGARNDY